AAGVPLSPDVRDEAQAQAQASAASPSPGQTPAPAPAPAPPAPVGGGSGACFIAGTMVSTPDGDRPIDELRPGDTVLTWDFARSRVVEAAVVELLVQGGGDH